MDDPATGSAAGPLAAYLWANNVLTSVENGVSRIEVVQSVQSGRRCLINLGIEPNKEDSVSVTMELACWLQMGILRFLVLRLPSKEPLQWQDI